MGCRAEGLSDLTYPHLLTSHLAHPLYVYVSCQVEENLRHSNDSLSLSRKEYDSLRRKVKTKRGIADAAKEVGPSPVFVYIYRIYPLSMSL